MSSSSSSQALALAWPVDHQALPTGWSRTAAFLIVGYLSASRSFAYLGLPWISLYIGEMALAAFLIFGPSTEQGRWVSGALRDRPLKRLKWLLLLSLCYGGFEALRGIVKGYPAFTAARDTAFNYYPLFLLLGLWVGFQDKEFLRRIVRVLAWWNGCYGLAYVVLLSRLPWTMPGTANAASTVPLFSEPYGSAIALLGLLAFEPKLRRIWHLLALNALVMLWVQVRAEWVEFTVGMLVFALCTKRVKRLVVTCAVLVALLGVMYIADVSLPSPEGRGGAFSARDIVARAVAPINEDLAASLSSSFDLRGYVGTAEWRLIMWAGVWSQVNTSITNAAFGLGYGYPIGDLNPLLEPGTFLQSPHSDFFYALAYSGWIGVVLFTLLQLELGRLLLRSYRMTRQPFGMICWASLLAASLFEAFFETPFGAIPFFLLAGTSAATGFVCQHANSPSMTPRRSPAAGTHALS